MKNKHKFKKDKNNSKKDNKKCKKEKLNLCPKRNNYKVDKTEIKFISQKFKS